MTATASVQNKRPGQRTETVTVFKDCVSADRIWLVLAHWNDTTPQVEAPVFPYPSKADHAASRAVVVERHSPRSAQLAAFKPKMKGATTLPSAPLIDGEVLCVKSWTAYLLPTVATAIAVPVVVATTWPLGSISVTFVLVLAVLGGYAAKVLSLLETMMFLDDGGVWYRRGGLAARAGTVGVRWPNLGRTRSRPTILWSRTHTVILRNRVTSREIVLTHMARGDLAVARIDALQETRLLDAR